MKDRLSELHQVVEEPPCAEISSTKWYDEPLIKQPKHMLKHFDENFLRTLKKQLNIFKPKSHRITKADMFLVNLQTKVERISYEVSKIRSNTIELTALHTSALMAPQVSPKEKQKLEELERSTRAAISCVVRLLKELELGMEPDSAAAKRIYSVQLVQARASFADAVEKCEAELRRYARGLRQQVERQIAIANGGRCDSGEVDACIENGNMQIFVNNYLTTEQEARTMLQDVEDRHKELEKVEQSIVEVHDLFSCIAVLVATQGDTIDSIEAHVEAANKEVAKGSKDLTSAKKKQGSARKKKIILGSIGAAVATGLVAVLMVA